MHAAVLTAANRAERVVFAAAEAMQEHTPRLFDSVAMITVAVLHPIGLLPDQEVSYLAEVWKENAEERIAAANQRAANFDPIG